MEAAGKSRLNWPIFTEEKWWRRRESNRLTLKVQVIAGARLLVLTPAIAAVRHSPRVHCRPLESSRIPPSWRNRGGGGNSVPRPLSTLVPSNGALRAGANGRRLRATNIGRSGAGERLLPLPIHHWRTAFAPVVTRGHSCPRRSRRRRDAAGTSSPALRAVS